MKTKEIVQMHIRLTDFEYEMLLQIAEELNMGLSKTINYLVSHTLPKLLNSDFDINIDYKEYLTLLDKVDGDKSRIKSPLIYVMKQNHFFMRNVKNRNYRASFALIIRLIIEAIAKGLVDIRGDNNFLADYSLYSYFIYTALTPRNAIIKPINSSFRRFLHRKRIKI